MSTTLQDNYADITPGMMVSSLAVKRNGKGTIFVSGPRFAKFRNDKRLTQAEFAIILGVSEDRIKQIEPKKKSRIYFKTAKKMAARLEISLEELELHIGLGTEPPSPPSQDAPRLMPESPWAISKRPHGIKRSGRAIHTEKHGD